MKKSNLTKVMEKAWKVAAPMDSGLSDCKAQLFPGVMEKFSLELVKTSYEYYWPFETELAYRTQSQHF